MLNPLMRVRPAHRRAPARRARAPARPRASRRDEAVRRLAEVGIRDPAVAERYPFELSGGMRQRVGHRRGARPRPGAPDRRRAVDRPRRDHPARDPRAPQVRSGLARDGPDPDHARPARRVLHVRPHLRALRGLAARGGAGGGRRAKSRCTRTRSGCCCSEPPGDRRLAHLHVDPGLGPGARRGRRPLPVRARCGWAAQTSAAGPTPLARLPDGRATACVRIGRDPRRDARRSAGEASRARARRGGEPGGALAPLVHVAISARPSSPAAPGRRRARRACRSRSGTARASASSASPGRARRLWRGCLVGLETPTDGSIEIDGIEAADYEALSPANAPRCAARVQMVFQDPYSSLNPVRTIGSTLKEALSSPAPARAVTASPICSRGSGCRREYAARKPVSLSGGERQRVAIARALAVEPRVLDLRRARLGARRLGPGADPQPLRDAAPRARALATSSSPTTWRSCARSPIASTSSTRGGWSRAGPVDTVLGRPSHEYTQKLVDSIPRSDSEWLTAQQAAMGAVPEAD